MGNYRLNIFVPLNFSDKSCFEEHNFFCRELPLMFYTVIFSLNYLEIGSVAKKSGKLGHFAKLGSEDVWSEKL